MQGLILHDLGLSWATAFTDSMVFSATLCLGSLTALTLYKYYQPGSQNRVFRLVFALCLAWICVEACELVMADLMQEDELYRSFLAHSFSLRYVFAFLVISGWSLLSWFLHLVQEQDTRNRLKNEAEKLHREAELFRIRQQLQPHFLFNSLNSISALIRSQPDEARKMIQKLSDFLRGTLKREDDKQVELHEEIRQLQLYLEIEKYRFGTRLEIALNQEAGVENTSLPPLLLQPIMENAIKFGLYGTTEQVNIQADFRMEPGFLIICIRNPFDPDSAPSEKGTGFGLRSVQRRLQLIYSRHDLLRTETLKNEFVTTVQIPQLR